MISDLVTKSFAKMQSLRKNAPVAQQPSWSPAAEPTSGMPTLQVGVYRPSSPMLAERFAMFGRWTHATHGMWLSIGDMARLWGEPIDDDVLRDVKERQVSAREHWPNEASALFWGHRLSLFAGSNYGNEKIYLLWLDFEEEPELWVYDANGESRYKNLAAYLEAFLADDVSACARSWRAGPHQVGLT